MITSEFKHLRKEQLKKRLKILHILIYLFAAMGLTSFVVFFMTHYKYNWSWLLIGFTYILLPVNYAGQMRRIRAELQRWEDRLVKESGSGTKF